MKPIYLVVIGIFVIILLNLYLKHKRDCEEREKLESWRNLWNAKKYQQFLHDVSTRSDLVRVVGVNTFLQSGSDMPIEIFFSGLIQYGFIQCKTESRTEYGRNYRLITRRVTTVSASAEAVTALENLLQKALRKKDAVQILLLYYSLYDLNRNFEETETCKQTAAYVRNSGLHICDAAVSEQLMRWKSMIHSEGTSVHFSDAERTLFGISGNLDRLDFLSTSPDAYGEYDEVTLKGHTLRFYPVSHTYFVDGIRVTSVTQLLKEVDSSYANYAGVSRAVLNRAAAKGTALHAEIQDYEEKGTTGYTQEFQNYLKLKKKNAFSVDACERYVIVFYQGIPVCAGRFDLLITTKENRTAMADIKRTSTYKKEDVTKQINLYRLGYIQTYGGIISEAYCLRLRETVAQFREVDIDDATARYLVEKYVKILKQRAPSYCRELHL